MELMVLNSQNSMSHLEDCIKSCSDHPECNFFTLEKRDDLCLLYEDCEDSLPCETCASGGKDCSRGYGSERILVKSTRGHFHDNLDQACGNAKGKLFHIRIHTVEAKVLNFEVAPDDTVLCVKAKLRDRGRIGHTSGDLILVFAGKQLKDDSTLAHNNIRENSVLWLIRGRQSYLETLDSLPDKRKYAYNDIKCRIPHGATLENYPISSRDVKT